MVLSATMMVLADQAIVGVVRNCFYLFPESYVLTNIPASSSAFPSGSATTSTNIDIFTTTSSQNHHSTPTPTSSSGPVAPASSGSGSSSQSSSHPSLSVGAIAGIAVGGFVALALLAVGIWFCCRQRRKPAQPFNAPVIVRPQEKEEFVPDPDPVGNVDREKM